MLFTALIAAAVVSSAFAKTVVVTVGGNSTDNPMGVFQPASVAAKQGDVVFFNFTQGNHTATQSTFSSPCIPAHNTDQTINGFDSGFRDTVNGTAITSLTYTVADSNSTIWFFDWNTCAQGGVGGINVNESSFQTLEGFQRNAIRLNGTNTTTSASSNMSSSASATSTSTSPSTSSTPTTSDSNQFLVSGMLAVTPALAILAALSF